MVPLHDDPSAPTRDDPHRALMAAVAAGDEHAFRELFDRTHARLHALAWSVLGQRDAAEEVVVETYERAWRGAASYDARRASVRTWLAAIARRSAFDRLRARGRRAQQAADGADAELALLASREPDPADTSAAREEAGRLGAALSGLPAEERRCLEAAFVGGLSHAEVAEALGQPLGTVKTRIRRALGTLRARLSTMEKRA